MKVLITGGGTAGHINPALAIADTIKKNIPNAEIEFVGTPRGLENTLVTKEGYKLHHVNIMGISRSLSLRNVKAAVLMITSQREAKKIIKSFNPDIVIGTGGYVCFPIFKQATKLHIPTMLHESNSIPGKVVTTMANKVDTIMVGFKQAEKRIKNAKNIVYTGTPSKMATYIPPENLRQKLDLK
jgi:UDP-N-acetylglucosamine--N-acetylmuramyl-(pentapeptide) pyrophosphoryl-undecaprenol N-acetylglucosamine transferase